MATLIVVSEKVLERIFEDVLPSAAVIIVTGATLGEAGVSEEKARELAQDYDFGGDPDVLVELVTHPGHYFLSGLAEEE